MPQKQRDNKAKEFYLELDPTIEFVKETIATGIEQMLKDISTKKAAKYGAFLDEHYIFENSAGTKYIMYFEIDTGSGDGYQRDFFSHKKAYGTKKLSELGLVVSHYETGNQASVRIKKKCIEDGWSTGNEYT